MTDNTLSKRNYTFSERTERRTVPVKALVKDIDLEKVKPKRAGVIMYTTYNGVLYFGLGVDQKSHDLTDFGGGVYYTGDRNAVRGALREFDEETLSIFKNITPEEISHCLSIYDENNLIIFVRIAMNPDLVSKTFNETYNTITLAHELSDTKPKKSQIPEVCSITWLTWEELQYCINEPGIIFSRVRCFLKSAGNFGNLI